MPDFARWRSTFANDVCGSSKELVSALRFARRIATCDSSVLLTGETGTGKEVFARTIHRSSNRHAGPFIAVNCAAIPEALIEAELFGYVKGAFTGAVNARAGKFAAANGGTLFLDEIGDLPLAAQAKLLRVLEERAICPVGADHELPVDIRIVAATHRDLEDMVERGQFRADLYFRISVLPLALPALRERGDDVLVLAEAVLARAAGRSTPPTLDETARAALLAYHWPGNVRELYHVLERALLLAGTPHLSAADLRLGYRRKSQPRMNAVSADGGVSSVSPVGATEESPPPAPGDSSAAGDVIDLRTALESLERTLIHRALKRAQGNRTEAAALLGLNRTTLVEKLRKYG